MSITITITQPATGQARLRISDPHNLLPDLAPARRLLVQALLSVEGEVGETEEVQMPLVALGLLRNFLTTVGATSNGKARRLLLMALLQLDDEDDARRVVKPTANLPVIAPAR